MTTALIKRQYWRDDGIFGTLYINDIVLYTAEHAYDQGNPIMWVPKVSAGTYNCIRYESPHLGYTVFKLENVPGATDILLHIGNTEADSSGCFLLGTDLTMGPPAAVLHSRVAFDAFMNELVGQDALTLVIED